VSKRWNRLFSDVAFYPGINGTLFSRFVYLNIEAKINPSEKMIKFFMPMDILLKRNIDKNNHFKYKSFHSVVLCRGVNKIFTLL